MDLSRRDDFVEFLKSKDISYDISGHGIEIQQDLDLSDASITCLPRDITVRGSLYLNSSPIQTLPARLVVDEDLSAKATPLTILSEDLSVGGSLILYQSKIMSLPKNLCVPGNLLLFSTPIEVLPEGLDVGKVLNLRQTGVTRFPSSLRVGDTIIPPANLIDIHNFMKLHTGEVRLELFGSQHQKMVVREKMRAFPDLWRIMVAMGENECLVLTPGASPRFIHVLR